MKCNEFIKTGVIRVSAALGTSALIGIRKNDLIVLKDFSKHLPSTLNSNSK